MTAGRSRVAKSPLFALFLLLAVSIEARPFRVNQIPNGNVNQCANCHVNPGGGGPRNSFGQAVEAGLISGDVNWGAALAGLDSDGDGIPNGQELQDPAGSWRPGQSAPGTASLVSKPGDSQSTPQAQSSAGTSTTSASSSSTGTPTIPAPTPLLSSPEAILEFGPVFLGESRALTLSVTNTGTASAATQPITLFGRNYRELSIEGSRLSVPAGGTSAVHITYTPTLIDSVAATVQLDFGFTYFETLITGWGVLRPPRLILGTPELDFGLGRVSFPDTLSFRVSNSGQENLRVSHMESGTALFAAFPATFEVAPGDTQNITVVYLHPKTGRDLDTLRIYSNDPTTTSAAVPLVGSSASPAISFSAETIHFDDLPFDQLPAVGNQVTRSLVIANAGMLPLRIPTISVADSAFSVLPESANLAAGDSLQVAVVYRPWVARLDTAALVILSDDPNHPEVRIPVFGAPLGRLGPQIQVDSTLVLDPVLLGASTTRVLHLGNRGNRTLAIRAVEIDPGAFRLGSHPADVDPGEVDSLAVAFSPVREGEVEALLSVQSNDPLRPMVLVRLSGTGARPPGDSPVAQVSPGDFNGDGRVDFTDFFLFADHFGGTDQLFDLDGDGRVDFTDFFLFADHFGSTVP